MSSSNQQIDDKYILTREDLILHLFEQLLFIRHSSMLFDRGFMIEGKRLATSIVMLVKEPKRGKGKSILSQLGIKDSITFPDTGTRADGLRKRMELVLNKDGGNGVKWKGSMMQYQRLLMLADGKSPLPYPPLLKSGMEGAKWLSFEDWWAGEALRDDQTGDVFSRADLILTCRDKDGGAHVDPDLPNDYANVKVKGSSDLTLIRAGRKVVMGPALCAIRQITFEVTEALSESILNDLNINLALS